MCNWFNDFFLDGDDSAGSDDDKDDTFGDSKNRSSRGLRVLSLKVRDIVSKKKKTSYKEVAEALLQDLTQKLKGKSQSEIVNSIILRILANIRDSPKKNKMLREEFMMLWMCLLPQKF